MRRKNLLLLFALLAATIFMAIGYASVNSITGEISGKATAKLQDDVFITNVEYESDNDAVLSSSNIQNYVGTMMKSTIKLSDTNADSSITYKVTVYNSSDEDVPFTEVIYGNEFYDNENIVFELSGFTIGQTIGPKETKDILITFKYKDGTIPDNQTLNSYLNFKLKVPNRIMAVNNWPNATDKFLTGTVTREKIEKVSFKKGKEPETTVISKFDASEKQDESDAERRQTYHIIKDYNKENPKVTSVQCCFLKERFLYLIIYKSWIFANEFIIRQTMKRILFSFF